MMKSERLKVVKFIVILIALVTENKGHTIKICQMLGFYGCFFFSPRLDHLRALFGCFVGNLCGCWVPSDGELVHEWMLDAFPKVGTTTRERSEWAARCCLAPHWIC